MSLYLAPGRPAQFHRPESIGAGAQGLVFGETAFPGVCFKIYLYPSHDLSRRVRGVLRLPPTAWASVTGHRVDLAWPQVPLTDVGGMVRGVVLRRVYGQPVDALLAPRLRLESLDRPTWATCIEVAIAIAAAFDALHRVGVVVGDVRPDNILVDRTGRVTLIDCDSVQFTDPHTKEFFPASHTTPAYASPESLAYGAVLGPAHDVFALAILVCQLLMEGDHPFVGIPLDAPDRGVEGNIARGHCRLFVPGRLRAVEGELTVRMLPGPVLRLARRTFVDGHHRPDLRPTAAEWVAGLTRTLNGLLGCRHNDNHYYPDTLAACVWCARRARGLGEHYPSSADAARDAELRRSA